MNGPRPSDFAGHRRVAGFGARLAGGFVATFGIVAGFATSIAAAIAYFAVRMLELLIRVYQLVVSPLLGPRCRFYPSCSHYALGALRRFGPLAGLWLALRRLARCHPWNPGGLDDVPDTFHFFDRGADGGACGRFAHRFSAGRWPRALRESPPSER